MEKSSDEKIIRALEIYPVMTVEMIAKETGIDERTAGNRMGMLYKKGAVRRQAQAFKENGTHGWRYVYFVKGREIRQMWHKTAIARVMLETRMWKRGQVHESHVIKIDGVGVRPDWSWYYEDKESLLYVFDEVQRKGDEFKEKVERYMECDAKGCLKKYGIEHFIVRTIAENEARMEMLRRIAKHVSGGSDLFWFTSLEWPIHQYKRADDDNIHYLLE